jgi:hypothetical protein
MCALHKTLAKADCARIIPKSRPQSRKLKDGLRASRVTTMNSRPNATEVAGRLLALRLVVTHAMATPPRDLLEEWLVQWTPAEREALIKKSEAQAKAFWNTVNTSPIFPYLSRWEREFANATILTMPSQEQIAALWRADAAQVLMWALHLVTQLPAPETQASPDLLKSEALSRPVEFLTSSLLRPEREIDRAREIAELWHWRSRTEELIREGRSFPSDEDLITQGIKSYRDIVRLAVNAAHERGDVHLVIAGDFGVKGKAYTQLSLEEWSEVRSISVERHRALNWLCGYSPSNDWDSTPTDT